MRWHYVQSAIPAYVLAEDASRAADLYGLAYRGIVDFWLASEHEDASVEGSIEYMSKLTAAAEFAELHKLAPDGVRVESGAGPFAVHRVTAPLWAWQAIGETLVMRLRN